MKKNILITGAAGFIGRALALYLRSHTSHELWGMDVQGKDVPGLELLNIDLFDHTKAARALCQRRPGIIFHLAGGRSLDAAAMFAANVRTTVALFDALAGIGRYRPRVVVMGSAAEYGCGLGPEPITEDRLGVIDTAYGQCKRAQTQAALCFGQAGADVVIARPFNILGPGIPAATAGGRFALQIAGLEDKPGAGCIATGHLGAVRDFLDIRDVCGALLAVAHKGLAGEIYNICSRKGVPMKMLLAHMIHLSRRRGLKVREDKRGGCGIPCAVGSNAKLRRDTGWRPHYTWRQSVEATLGYYRAIVKAGP